MFFEWQTDTRPDQKYSPEPHKKFRVSFLSAYKAGASSPISPTHRGSVKAACCKILMRTPRLMVTVESFLGSILLVNFESMYDSFWLALCELFGEWPFKSEGLENVECCCWSMRISFWANRIWLMQSRDCLRHLLWVHKNS